MQLNTGLDSTPAFFNWLDLLGECQPNLKIARELKSLDFAQICHPRNISPADHHYQVHAWIFSNPSNPRPEQTILDWLQVNSVTTYLHTTCTGHLISLTLICVCAEIPLCSATVHSRGHSRGHCILEDAKDPDRSVCS